MASKAIYSNVSDDAMAKATGKTWGEWFAVLDAGNASKMGHKEMAVWLYENHLKKDWWCQTVTVGYEQARGLRKVNQQADGFRVSVSRTMPVALTDVYAAWADPAKRTKWLPGRPGMNVTTANVDKNIRGKWDNGKSSFNVNFYVKGGKTQVVVQHEQLAEEADVEKMRTHWKQALDALEELLAV